MTLHFKSAFKSIRSLTSIELSSLTILTGINGSGKSHLLQSILNGHVYLSSSGDADDVAAVQPQDVRLITSADVSPVKQGNTQIASLRAQFQPSLQMSREIILEPYRKRVREGSSAVVQYAGQQGLDVFLVILGGLGSANLPTHEIQILRQIASDAEKAILESARRAETVHMRRTGHIDPLSLLSDAASRLQKSPLQITEDDILSLIPDQSEQFAINWNVACTRYRDVLRDNYLRRMRDGRVGIRSSLSDEQIRAAYGTPPWEIMTESIQSLGLPYTVDEPDMASRAPVSFCLRSLDTADLVQVEDLSSGEGVLLRFALALFRTERLGGLRLSFPKLLLLDELDAWLHPEMMQRWLQAVSTNLVQGREMSVVIATHSPTMVALSPEHAIYQMVDSEHRIEKVTKQAALDKLTVGVPTLAIDFSGRRQVFTESHTDAKILEKLLNLVKGELNLPRTLSFIPVGFSSQTKSELNGGCANVLSIVKSLREKDVRSVFGIIDRDQRNGGSEDVFAVAPNLYYSIENVILDPLLIALFLIKFAIAPLSWGPLPKFVEAASLDNAQLQRMADFVESALQLPSSDVKVDIFYLNEKSISVGSSYTWCRGHDLETRLLEKIPRLREFGGSNKPEGTLVTQVIRQVIMEYPGFCPRVLTEIFKAIAGDP